MNSIDAARYIFFHSLFDERKCAQRFSFELKCAFENTGKHLERPDYYGTGEAGGDFCEVNMESLRRDIKTICSYGNCILIGLRFGSALLLDYLKCNQENISAAVIIEPVCNLNDYVEYLKQKQRIKDILTGLNEIDQKEEKYVNIEGYKTQKKFLEQLKSYGVISLENCFNIPVSIISNTDSRKNNSISKMSILDYEPFWERIPPQDHSELINLIIEEVCAI